MSISYEILQQMRRKQAEFYKLYGTPHSIDVGSAPKTKLEYDFDRVDYFGSRQQQPGSQQTPIGGFKANLDYFGSANILNKEFGYMDITENEMSEAGEEDWDLGLGVFGQI